MLVSGVSVAENLLLKALNIVNLVLQIAKQQYIVKSVENY